MTDRQLNLADLFEVVVDTLPDREALVAGDQRRTYRELDDRANRFANALADREFPLAPTWGFWPTTAPSGSRP